MQLSGQILKARDLGQTIERPSSRGELREITEGYEVYREVDALLRQSGYTRVGRKIGFSNKATWNEFGLDSPIWAYVYDRTVAFAPVDETALPDVSVGQLVAPRLEPEIVLRVNERIESVGWESQALVDAIEWVAIGFEIVDCHFEDWQFSAAEIVADLGAHAKLVVGNPSIVVDEARQLLAPGLQETTVKLLEGNQVIQEGVGKNVLGGPVEALGFLMRTLAEQEEAEPLGAGEIITTGTLTPFPYIYPGQRWTVIVDGLALSSLAIRVCD